MAQKNHTTNLTELLLQCVAQPDLNTPPETVPLDRTNGAAKPLKWCMVTAAIVH